MKYFFDCEFIEGFHKPLFGKRRHFIDLISIGIVAEDGREYYAISNEFNPNDADEWVKENVISKLESYFGHRGMKAVKMCGKSNIQIAKEIKEFIFKGCEVHTAEEWGKQQPIEFYSYFGDYDWVLFCSLFGRMIDLPKGFPMYCRDLKQMLDEVLEKRIMTHLPACGEQKEINSNSNISLENKLYWAKSLPAFPIQSNEHDALSDARWNKQLYNFIISL